MQIDTRNREGGVTREGERITGDEILTRQTPEQARSVGAQRLPWGQGGPSRAGVCDLSQLSF